MAIGTAAALNRAGILHPQHLTAILGFSEWVACLHTLPRHFQGIARQGQGHARPAGIAGAGKYLAMQRLIGQPRTPARLTRL